MTNRQQWHKVDKSTYLRQVGEDFAASRLWMAVVPSGALAAAGCIFDPVWLMVLLVAVCLVAPLLLVLLYFNYSMTPEAIAAIRPHTTEIDAHGNITMHFMPDEETGRSYRPLTITANSIGEFEERGNGFMVARVKGKPFRYVFLPVQGNENLLPAPAEMD